MRKEGGITNSATVFGITIFFRWPICVYLSMLRYEDYFGVRVYPGVLLKLNSYFGLTSTVGLGIRWLINHHIA